MAVRASEDTKIGGASAGSLIAATYHSGIGSKAATTACLALAAELRKNGTRGRLKVRLKQLVHESHPCLLLPAARANFKLTNFNCSLCKLI